MPVPYFTQLLGLALGLPEAGLGLDKLVVPLAPALAAARLREAVRTAEPKNANGTCPKENTPCA
jgi:heterodisulfide reductase subunit B